MRWERTLDSANSFPAPFPRFNQRCVSNLARGKRTTTWGSRISTVEMRSALLEFRAAEHLKPELSQSHAALGTALSQLNETDAAIDEFKAALKIDARYVPALDGLTKVLIDQRRYSAAIAYLRNAPPDDALELNLAIAYARNRNNDEALQVLSGIVEKQPLLPWVT